MIGTGLALPRGGMGAKSEQKTKQGAHLESVVQRMRFKRQFFDKVIGGPEVQYARLSIDAGGFKTYLSPEEYGRLNPVEQIFCEQAESSNPNINRSNQFQRVCYICGFKMFGKDAIKRGYPDGGLKGTQYLKDWRYPQIEHVMNMMEGTQYGAVTPKIRRGTLLRENATNFTYPDYDPDDTPQQKLQKLIDFNTGERNNWPVQWYEYLWSHLLCNQVKGDVRFMRIQINDGIPQWENNNPQIDSTQNGITKLLKNHENKDSIQKWINASSQWWNPVDDQLKKYIAVFCQRMTFQNMRNTNNPIATHEWTPSPLGQSPTFKFDQDALQTIKTKVIPDPVTMWPNLLNRGDGPKADKALKGAFRWIQSKLIGTADDKSKYLKDSKAARIAIPAFLKEEVPTNVPGDAIWRNNISKIPVETRREAFLLLPKQELLRTHYNKYAELFTKIFGDAEKAEQTESKAITLQDGPDDPETQNPEFTSGFPQNQLIVDDDSPPGSPMAPRAWVQGTPPESMQASMDPFAFQAAPSFGTQPESQGDQSQRPQWGSPAVMGIQGGGTSPTPTSGGPPRKQRGRGGLRGGALAVQFGRSELKPVPENELIGGDIGGAITMIEEAIQEEDEEEEKRDEEKDMRLAEEEIRFDPEFEKAQAQKIQQELLGKRDRKDTNGPEDPKKTRGDPFILKDISELKGGDDLYNQARALYYSGAGSRNNGSFGDFKDQNNPIDDDTVDSILKRWMDWLNTEMN